VEQTHTHKIYCVLHVAGYKDPSLTLDDFWLTEASGSALVQLFCEFETLYSALYMSHVSNEVFTMLVITAWYGATRPGWLY
jgi:hypothetical protein